MREPVKTGACMLFLVVGPSGAGKDTLMDGVRAELAGDLRFRFVRRMVTRAPGVGEDHHPATPEDFAAMRDAGGFALHWEAHGLGYGIPADIDADLQAGRTVIANVSRGVIAQAARRHDVVVLEITAPPEVLAARLAGRGRESVAEIADRLARQMAVPDGVRVVRVVNDGPVADGVAAVLAAVRGGGGSGS
jgi:ribose 1,5-bisphosphokinase